MYTILENPPRMTPKEVANAFNGKWIYLVDLEGSPFTWFKSAIPAVVADKEFAGSETGIYDKLNEKYNGNITTWSLLHDEFMFGFSEVLADGN